MRLTERQHKALRVVRDYGEVKDNSAALRATLGGGRVNHTMSSLAQRGLIARREERTDHGPGTWSVRYFGWVLTPAGRKFMESR